MGNIERGGNANVFIDQRLKIGRSFNLPIKDSIPPEEGPASIALGPDRKLIFMDQDGVEHTVPTEEGLNKTEFKYIEADQNNVVHVNGSVRKVVISANTKLDALIAEPGQTGILIVKQDDLGGHIVSLAEGNKGSTVTLNTFPRAQTEFTWKRYDDNVYWKNEVLDPGIAPTTIPVFAINDYLNKLDIFHQAGYSEIEISINDGPWVPYLSVADPSDNMIHFGAVDRPEGYWKARVRANEPTRLVSLIATSKPVIAAQVGFDYTLDLTLT